MTLLSEGGFLARWYTGYMNCLVEDCEIDTGRHGAKGYCRKHYGRFVRTGDPLLLKHHMDTGVYPEDRKPCSACHKVLGIDQFYLIREGSSSRQAACKDCMVIRTRERRKSSPDSVFESNLRSSARKLGLDPERLLNLYSRHSGLCDLCGRKPVKSRLHMDHDHKTGKFRGWLCSTCNTGIGLLKDNPELLIKAANYVENGGVAQ